MSDQGLVDERPPWTMGSRIAIGISTMCMTPTALTVLFICLIVGYNFAWLSLGVSSGKQGSLEFGLAFSVATSILATSLTAPVSAIVSLLAWMVFL